MNEQTTHNLMEAVKAWLSEAIGHIKKRPEQWAEVVKCMKGNGDVRIVFYAKENCVAVEAADYDESTVAEVFRQHLVPNEGGFALPDTPTPQ